MTMSWNEVEIVPPPRDRVIEVTSGAAWMHEDTYHPRDARRRPHTTWRHWKFQGGVALVLWHEGTELGGHLAETGAWIDTMSGGVFPGFRFWREYENPLAGHNGLLTSTVPPYPLNQDFEGDARLRLYDQIEDAILKQIAWAERVIARDVDDGREPSPGTVRAKATYEANLARTRAERVVAYDPHDLPVDVRGEAK
jgi:hypothetical protein